MSKPKISIIMGIYNCETTLEASIESMIIQTYTNWELIMCDDGSSDETLKIAQEYEKKIPDKIKVIQNEQNMGLSFSLNHCLENANGEYVARMDSDDINFPERFEKQVEFLNNNPQYAVVGSAVILKNKDEIKGIRLANQIPKKELLAKQVPFMHPTIMMRKSVYDALNGYTVSRLTRRGQDADLWFRFYAAGYSGYNLQEPLLYYSESLDDYKKRSLSKAWDSVIRTSGGINLLKLPIYYQIFAIKPIISALIPNKLMYMYHKKKY
ncbi:MAG: glycosyltransferase [Culicoidibacterales bacterium]